MSDGRIYEAELGDIYADADGKRWRVTAVDQPVAHLEQIDAPTFRQEGGISDHRWKNFRRISRPSHSR